MNKIYRIIWSPALQAWIAVSEFAKSRGKSKNSRTRLAASAAGVAGAMILAMIPIEDARSWMVNPASLVNGGVTADDGGNTQNIAIGNGAVAKATDGTTNVDIIAIGYNATATSVNAMALGWRANAEGSGSIAFGPVAKVLGSGDTSLNSMAIGNHALVDNAPRATAIGPAAYASADSATGIGAGSRVTGLGATGVGFNVNASSNYATAVGYEAEALGINNIAIGSNATAGSGTAAIDNAVAIGSNSSASANLSMAIGNNAVATQSGGLALGSDSKADTASGIAGYSPSSAPAASKTLINNTVSTRAAVSVGDNTAGIRRQITDVAAGNADTDAVNVAQLKGLEETPLTFAGNTGSVAKTLGSTVTIKGGKTTAGTYSDKNMNTVVDASGNLNIQMADNPVFNSVIATNGTNTTTLAATGLTVTGGPSVTTAGIDAGGSQIKNVGAGVNDTDGVNVSQLKNETAKVKTHYYSVNDGGVVGANYNNDAATGLNALAAGVGAQAAVADGVALGSGSVASTAAGKAGYLPAGLSGAAALAINATTSTLGAVSVGDSATGKFRQITGVAAGAEDSDAVNVAQLSAVSEKTDILDDRAVKYDVNPGGDVNYNSVTMGGATYNSTTKTGGTRITNVARGVDDSDAVNMSQLNETNENVTNVTDTVNNFAGDQSESYTEINGRGIRYVRTNDAGLPLADAYANGQGSTAVGYNARSTGLNSLALGRDTQSINQGDVALGSGSVTDVAVATTGVRINDVDYAFAGINPLSTVSVGRLGNERTITNVAAGRITADSTDAINGSQLFATNTAIDTLDKGAVKYDINTDGSVNYNHITLGGDTYDNSTHTGGTIITNVADGVAPSDAVNMSQLNQTNENVTNITDTVNNFAGDQSTSYTEINGRGIRYVRTNDAGLPLADAYANGQGSTAVGYNARSTGLNSLALGRDAQSLNEGDVALGAGSVTDAAVATTGVTINGVDYTFAGINPLSTVSVGSLGHERTITNVAAGRITADSTDAINGSQLYATNAAINTLDKGAVKYDINTDGTVNYNSITLGGDTYNSVTKTGGTRIKNVAYGIDMGDAVNVQQLTDATTNIYNNGTKYFHAASDKADSVATGMDSVAVGPNAQSLGNGSIAMGDEAKSTGAGSAAIGQGAQTIGDNSVAMGSGAIANNANDVALGAGSVTQAAIATSSVTINGDTYAVAGNNPTSTVSVGSAGNERTITNVAAGRITADSTDAVNGSELYATNQAIEKISGDVTNLDAGSVKYEINNDGTVNYNKVTMGGDTYDNSTHTGGTTITNVANGVAPSDAVNKYQLDQVDQHVTNISEGTDGMFQVNNTSKLPKPKPTGIDSTAGGAGAVASGDYSMSIGANSKATHNNAVALGYNSVTDRDNSVSVGSAGHERQVTNVAAGTADTDAANVGQLKQGVNNSYQYTNKKFNDLKNMVDDQKDKLSAGIAGAMATAGLPQPYEAGASMVGLAGGTYQGESAIALGVSTISDNGKWVTKISGNTNSKGDVGASVGVGYQF